MFTSAAAKTSLWVEREIQAGLERGRALIVCIDDSPLPLYATREHSLRLAHGGEIINNRVDDLIVRLYWLMFRAQNPAR
jgi:hypothetical protein